MSLSSLQLDAFQEVARARSFSGAAKALHLTQSALSQRVLKLEEELGTTLFVREPAGLRLTEAGEKLLRYCQSRSLLEEEFLGGLEAGSNLRGQVRIAGFSTAMRSLVLPVIGGLVKAHPGLQISLQSAELRDLPGRLYSGEADFILVNRPLEKAGVENHLLGFEENVLVRPKGKNFRVDVFLDHDPEDPTTEEFFRLQGKKPTAYRRSYLDEIYAILDGVRAGLGSAVVPLHIARDFPGIEVAHGFKALRVPIYLSYYRSEFPTKLQKETAGRLRKEIPELL